VACGGEKRNLGLGGIRGGVEKVRMGEEGVSLDAELVGTKSGDSHFKKIATPIDRLI